MKQSDGIVSILAVNHFSKIIFLSSQFFFHLQTCRARGLGRPQSRAGQAEHAGRKERRKASAAKDGGTR